LCLQQGNFIAIDPNGNTTQKTKNGTTTTFHYDIRNQLGEVRESGNILGRYGYDYDGRRILKIGDDGRRQYTYDQLSVITEADQVNATVSKYDYGMDQLVRLDNRTEGRSFFHLDFLGSTVGLTDPAGAARQSIFYDAWGNERDRIGASANNFTFTGHEKDEETGLIYAKARFYDPDVGRFLTQDSLLGDAAKAPSLHRYAYANSNPVRFADPDGRAAVDFAKGFAVSALTAVVVVVVVATAPVSIPASVVTAATVAGLSFTAATVVQSSRQRDLLNNPISQEQADFQMGTAFGGLAVAAGAGPTASLMSKAIAPGPALATTTGLVVAEATTVAPALVSVTGGATSVGVPMSMAMVNTAVNTGDGGGGGSSGSSGDDGGRRLNESSGDSRSAGKQVDYQPLKGHPSDPDVPGGPENARGRFQAALDAEGQPRLPDDFDVHHTTPQRLLNPANPQHHLAGQDIHHPSQLRGVPGSRQPGTLEVSEPFGRVRSTNVHAEMDLEISEFLKTNPTQSEFDEFTRFMDWRWGHSFWESGAFRSQ
jgi:RHS repeat-associated protein